MNRIKSILYKTAKWKITGLIGRILIKTAPRWTPTAVYTMTSISYRTKGDTGTALIIAKKGVSVKGPTQMLISELAECFMLLADWERASKLWREVISMENLQSKPRVWIKLARCFRQMHKGQAAQLTIEKGMELYPKIYELHLEAAKIAHFNESWAKAANLWSSVIDNVSSKESEKIKWKINHLKSLRLGGKLNAASKFSKKYSNVKTLDYMVELAEINTKIKTIPEALISWKKAQKFAKKNDNTPLSTRRNIDINILFLSKAVDYKKYKKDISRLSKNKKTKNYLKIAVYTSYTKGYDNLKPHSFLDQRFDYFAFTDENIDGFELYKVKDFPKKGLDGARAIRYPKTHPHILFPDYDIAVWLDTSIILIDDIYPTIERFFDSGLPIGVTPHTNRGSLFEEFLACIDLGKDNTGTLMEQFHLYEREGFKSNNLSENGFILFNLKHPKLKPAMGEWWSQITTYSKRDQLSFAYSLNKHKVEWFRNSEPPENINNNPAFLIAPHKHEYESLNVLMGKLNGN